MLKHLLSPVVRISFGVTMLTISLLLVSDFLGLAPNSKRVELEHRTWATESLAVQVSIALTKQNIQYTQSLIDAVVERNKSILSVAVRDKTAEIIVKSGNHERHWNSELSNDSTANQVQVPIFEGEQQWGKIEISFQPLNITFGTMLRKNSLFCMILFVASVGFFTYRYFLKKVIRELNTDDVIPERVSKALDTLTEGIVIIDADGYIVFSNSTYCQLVGLEPNTIVGLKMDHFEWLDEKADLDACPLPWNKISVENPTVKGESLSLRNRHGKTFTLTVNATAVGHEPEKIQGMMVTFDNMSDIATKNEQLGQTLVKLQRAQEEVTEQNRQLHILATRDPLTNTLNRRSLYTGLQSMLSEASWNKQTLCFLMIDIDHFKSVNDNYGHGVGDKVIVFLAQCLNKHTRSLDLVARFGGEEFCVALPNTSLEEAKTLAEKMRVSVENDPQDQYPEELKITASFGLTVLSNTAIDAESLIEEADKALYFAKENGRNQVVCWPHSAVEQTHPTDNQAHGKQLSTQPRQNTVSELPKPSLDQHPQNTTPVNKREIDVPGHFADLLLFDRIDQAIKRSDRYATQFAVIALDIEMIQRINNTLGPAVGKKMLRAINTRLETALRETDSILSQYEDDPVFSISTTENREIVLLLTDLSDTESLHAVTERISTSQAAPLEIEGNEYMYSAIMGVSVYPQDGSDSQTLLRNANIAKSEAASKKYDGNVCFFSDDIEKQSRQQILLAAELFRTIERDELVLFYQPKANLETGELVGFEALLRWQHPSRGLIPPDEFIPIAESTGLILDLSQWVIRNVCRQISNWREQGLGDIQVSINLSAVEFRNKDLAKSIINTAKEFDIPMHCLEVEVTETIAVDNIQVAIDTLREVAAAGIAISMDDFGTGYASLSYLQSLPIHKIKIDRSFIDGLLTSNNDSSIVSAVIAMGHTLGLEVIAEGVETFEQMQFLQDMHCDQIQGYFLSRPISRENTDALIQNYSAIQQRIVDSENSSQGDGFKVSGAMLSVLNNAPAVKRL